MKKKYTYEELINMSPVELYQLVLDGEVPKFPKGYWIDFEPNNTAVPIIRYLVEEKLKLSDEDILASWNYKLIVTNKLSGMIRTLFSSSPYLVIEAAYPGKFKPWEFKTVPRDFWTKEMAIDAIKWLVEDKLKLSDEEVLNQWSTKFLKTYELQGMLHLLFSSSPYLAIDAAYPGKFKPWEFKNTPQDFWTKEMAIEAVKWLVEDKLKLSNEEVLNQWNAKLLKTNRLQGMLKALFFGSPYLAIDAAYPGKFKPWEFKGIPQGYWSRETGIEAIKWLVEDKLKLSDEEIFHALTIEIFKDYGLNGMLNTFFKGNVSLAIQTTYPDLKMA